MTFVTVDLYNKWIFNFKMFYRWNYSPNCMRSVAVRGFFLPGLSVQDLSFCCLGNGKAGNEREKGREKKMGAVFLKPWFSFP